MSDNELDISIGKLSVYIATASVTAYVIGIVGAILIVGTFLALLSRLAGGNGGSPNGGGGSLTISDSEDNQEPLALQTDEVRGLHHSQPDEEYKED